MTATLNAEGGNGAVQPKPAVHAEAVAAARKVVDLHRDVRSGNGEPCDQLKWAREILAAAGPLPDQSGGCCRADH